MHAKWSVLVVASVFLLVGALFAREKPQKNTGQNMLSATDQTFITHAAEANLAEIETAKMVKQKSTDPAVKDFADRMITDHAHANQSLATLAETSRAKLPSQPSAAERNQKDELQKLSGVKLNDAYLRDELQGHKQVISEFEDEIEHGQDQGVKSYAERTLPTLQDHIRIAENLSGKMGMAGKAGLTDEAKAITAK